jgi:S-adenosylmethionine-diacylglycerol 3-amino-3-carboxypropyl transferase
MENHRSDASNGQVQLDQLLFGKSWEDPDCDRRALRISSADKVVAIASGGCNVFELLLDDPREIVAVDISPAQVYLVELKVAAIRRLDLHEYLSFIGIAPSTNRQSFYVDLRESLSREARDYWDYHSDLINLGIQESGRYEQFLRMFRRLLRVLQGRRRIQGLFDQRTGSQNSYFDTVWNTPQWRLIFRLFFNKRILAKRGLASDYFKFADGASSFAESFFRRTEHALKRLPVGSNYFLQQYLLGEYLVLPSYLQKDNYDLIRSRLDKIRLVVADLKHWLSSQPAASISCFSLSNICELMDEADTRLLFDEVVRTAVPGARICFRNLMVPREARPSPSVASRIVKNDSLSKSLVENDRSFVYSKVEALEIVDA